MSPHPVQQQPPHQQYTDDQQQRSFGPTGLMTAPPRWSGAAPMMATSTPEQRPATYSGTRTKINADGEDAYTSSSSSRSARPGEKRKASTEPRGEANKRSRLLSGMADKTVRNAQETLDSFKRNLGTSMPADFAATGASAIQRIPTLQAAEDFVRQQGQLVKHYKLRINSKDDDVKQVDDEYVEVVRESILACLQEPPKPGPQEHPFDETYNHDHNNQHKDLMSKLVTDQNHLEAASKVFMLIEKVKSVHEIGVAMADLNASKFKTQEDITSPWLPGDAETRIAKKPIAQTLTCTQRMHKIAEAIKINKWIANDIMRGTGPEDWMVLILCPDECLHLKATNWDSNYRKKTKNGAKERSLPQEGDEVISLDDD